MGVVYLARAEGPEGQDELFAVKTLLPEYAGEEQYRRMFLGEANLGVRLEHPNIVRTVEVGGSKKHHYMALEYLQGQSLRAVRKAHGGIEVDDGVRILSDVLAALSYAHALRDLDGHPLGIVHRDMSPDNIFLTYDARVILLDFGVAKADDSHEKTEVGKLKGRIRYMAPEQVLGWQVDGRADIFAVGILLWELLSGTRFWGGIEEVAILRSLLEAEIPRLPPGEHPARLVAVCEKALAAKPEARFATAEAFRLELDAAALELGQRSSLQHLARRMELSFADARSRIRSLVAEGRGPGAEGVEGEPLPSVSLPSTEASMASRSGMPASISLGSSPAGVVDVRTFPPRPRPALLAIALLAVALLGAALAFRLRALPDADRAAVPRGASAAASEPAPTPPTAIPTVAGTVELVIDVAPHHTQVLLDGVLLSGGSPYRRRLERDDKPHVLELSAPGHDPRVETVVFNGNVTLRLALDKSEGKGSASRKRVAGAGSAAPEPSAAPSPGPVIKGGAAPDRDINTSNPYGN